METENKKLTMDEQGWMELVFLQLSYDEMTRLFNLDCIKNDRSTLVERALVRDAFNTAFKALKRSITGFVGERVYEDTMEMMADVADELEWHSGVVYNSYLKMLCNRIQYKYYEPMARTLTLVTLIKTARVFFINATGCENKRIRDIIKSITVFTDAYKVRMFAGETDFDTSEINVHLQSLLRTALEKIREYERENNCRTA